MLTRNPLNVSGLNWGIVDNQTLLIVLILVSSLVSLISVLITSLLVLVLLSYAHKADLFLDKLMITCENMARLMEYFQRRDDRRNS